MDSKDKKITSLFDRIDGFGKKIDKGPSSSKKDVGGLKHLRVVLNVSLEFLSGIIVGLFFGYMLDKIFDTKMIFIIIFAILGFVAGLLNLFRYIKDL